jgi:hypothetical protein
MAPTLYNQQLSLLLADILQTLHSCYGHIEDVHVLSGSVRILFEIFTCISSSSGMSLTLYRAIFLPAMQTRMKTNKHYLHLKDKNRHFLDGFTGQLLPPGVCVQLIFETFQGIGLGNI